MSIETLSKDEMLELASKVVGDELGLKTLLRDVRRKAESARRDEKVATDDLERIKARVAAAKVNTMNWESFEAILQGLVTKWGLDDVEVLPSKERTQDDPDPAPVAQKVAPETQERMQDGKLCMYKDQKTKKWCPTRLTGTQKKKASIYCAKHHAIVHGN